MLIYNTLSKKKEEFIPINPPKVNMYMCGPTVYDYFHIGNGRSFIMSDIIRRYLEYKGYDVNFVMNLTDIDDKIIRKANEQNVSFEQVAKTYSEAFFEDIAKLGIKKATINPKATEHINQIIEMISALMEKGHAYNIDGDVFYDVNSFEGYGKLSGKNTEDLESGARVEINESKKNPLDFSLWKKAKEGEPYWESPWGKGRPGWHIECSAMSSCHLGETIDIHAGGSDLIFPHHENEIAQSEAASGKAFVKYWLHFGFLNIDNEKMSKSLGNFFTARDILKKYPKEAVRVFLCQAHYAGQLNFSEDLIHSAQKGLEKITNTVEAVKEGLKNPGSETGSLDFSSFYKHFETAMDDDFNTPKAVAVIYDFVRAFNTEIAGKNMNAEFYRQAEEFLEKTACSVLGIASFESETSSSGSIEDELISLLLNVRFRLKAEKNYAFADEIRQELNRLGVEIKDSKTGSTYKKV